ncbi:uncharacterized protein LOC121829490 [Peromyscus maniculatus bairdii]|uniref:uncharacterized protein LOC121829490 n=1 Tax=Peromyscus maniculatus bairdii TaxID=230844 RepID=UPI003FD2AFD9
MLYCRATHPSLPPVFRDASMLCSVAFTSVSSAKETGMLSPIRSFRMKRVHTDRASELLEEAAPEQKEQECGPQEVTGTAQARGRKSLWTERKLKLGSLFL